MNIESGRYGAAFTGECSVYENAKGSLVAAFGIQVEGTVRTWFATLVNADGAVNTRRVADLKVMLGWDGVDPSWLVEHPEGYAGSDCEVTIENETGQDGKTYANIKYVDPPGGGGGGAKLPEPMSKQALMAKYSAKFRAVSGGTPARPAAKAQVKEEQPMPPQYANYKPPSAPPSRPPVGPPPAPRAQTVTMEECWAAMCESGKDRKEMEQDWFELIEQVGGKGAQAADFTPEQFAELKLKIDAYVEQNRDEIPF